MRFIIYRCTSGHGDAAAREREKWLGLHVGIGAGRAWVPQSAGGKGGGMLKHLRGMSCR